MESGGVAVEAWKIGQCLPTACSARFLQFISLEKVVGYDGELLFDPRFTFLQGGCYIMVAETFRCRYLIMPSTHHCPSGWNKGRQTKCWKLRIGRTAAALMLKRIFW